MIHSFEINEKLITLNEYIKIERGNKYKAAKLKKVFTLLCSIYAKNIPKLEGLFDIELIWETKDNKTDPDNIYFAIKFILDGLVLAQKNKGYNFKDGRKNIRNINNSIKTTGKDKVTVYLIKFI